MAPQRPSSPDPSEGPGDVPPEDPHGDPHDDEQVREGRRLVATWYLWPLILLVLVMVVGYLAAR